MKKTLILLLCGLLIGAAAAWALIHFVIPNWHRSAVDNTFFQVTSKLDQGGEVFAYFHAEKVSMAFQAVMDGLKKNVGALPEARQLQAKQGLDMLDLMFKGYGLEEISGLGFSSFAVKPGLHRVRVVIHHRLGKNKGLIWNVTGPAPRSLDEIELLPADTALAFVADYNFAKLIEWLGQLGQKIGVKDQQGQSMEQGVAMMKSGLQAIGIDADRLLKSYGGRLGFLLTLDPEKRVTLPLGAKPLSIPEPAFALLLRVNDAYLFDTLKTKLTATGHNKATEEKGIKKIVFPRLPAPFPLEPVIAQKGQWLLLASRNSLVENIFNGQGPRLSGSADFREMAYKLPRSGNGFSYASPLLPRLIAQMLRENMAAFPVPSALEKITAFIEKSKGFCQVWENSDQGLIYTINHGFEISSLPGLLEAFMEIAREKKLMHKDVVPPPPVGDEVEK
ncbi:MAG TPA: hypothetical protein VMZ49_08560 [Patescibacteria group bacterium]|nr:hypothetical protein [Patescibacteria group bacterium]